MTFPFLQTINWEPERPELSTPNQRSPFIAIRKSLRLYILNETANSEISIGSSVYICSKDLLDAICKAVEVSCNRYDCVKSEVTCIPVIEMKLPPTMFSQIESDCLMHPVNIGDKAVNITDICSWFIKCANGINKETLIPAYDTSDETFNLSQLAISTKEVEDSCSTCRNETIDDVAMIDVTVSSSRFDPDEGTTNPYDNAYRLQQLQDTTVPGIRNDIFRKPKRQTILNYFQIKAK